MLDEMRDIKCKDDALEETRKTQRGSVGGSVRASESTGPYSRKMGCGKEFLIHLKELCHLQYLIVHNKLCIVISNPLSNCICNIKKSMPGLPEFHNSHFTVCLFLCDFLLILNCF